MSEAAKLTDKETHVLALAWKCFKTGAPDIDMPKLAALAGYTNTGSCTNAMRQIRKKLDATAEGSPPATPGKRAPGGGGGSGSGSVGSGSAKRKAGAGRLSVVAGSGGDDNDDDEELASPKKPKRGAAAAAKKSAAGKKGAGVKKEAEGADVDADVAVKKEAGVVKAERADGGSDAGSGAGEGAAQGSSEGEASTERAGEEAGEGEGEGEEKDDVA